MTPSFFTEHTYNFGDTPVKNRAEKQAFFESLMRSQLIKVCGQPTTDFVVAPLDQVFVMWTAVIEFLAEARMPCWNPSK